ncbi:MAG: T9SS type A sorting domain-containing protein [Bacteroidales bacterium]|nr:T9SS type A sorting domain-containing protein [Bacteroidales bacterium]
MKTKILLFLSVFLAATAFAAKDWVKISAENAAAPYVTILQQDNSKVILHIQLPGFFSETVTHDGITFRRLELIPFQTTKEAGKPELPMLNHLIGIPDNKLVKINILDKKTTGFENFTVFPFQTPTTDNPGGWDHEFVMDKNFYSENKNYPGKQVYLDNPGIWRDVKVAGLHIVPFEYNPATGKLTVTREITLEIEFYGYDGNLLLNRDKLVSPMFYRMYENKIINFSSLGYMPDYKGNNDIKYLIITNTNPLGSIQPLVDWKNQQGHRVEVKVMEAGFNTPQNFKDYITQLYNSDDLEYVLMVGDAYPNGGNGGGPDDVPMFWWAPSGEDASYSDSWYSCLDGPDDHYADLAIGRFVYDNLAELDLQIQKTLDHYKNPESTTNWAENSILIAHKEQYPGKYTQCCEEIRTFSYALQTPIFEPAYGGAGYTNDQVVSYVNNNSCGIFNYRGHGSATELAQWCNQGSFTATHVNQLTNTDRLFVFFDVCCDNMDIVAHAGNCLCESFMKSPVASVAVNGAIIPSYTIPNHDYDKEMYKAVFHEGIYNIGYVTNFANVTVLNVHGTIGRSNVRTYLWLGDASLEPWTLQPGNMIVNHNPTIFLGLTEFSVTVMGNGPVENAMVCITNDDQTVYGVAYTDAGGMATIVFDGPVQNPGTAKLTVTAHNFLPYQADLDIIPASGPYVIKEAYAINDIPGGNGDGLMDYGESILLDLSMTNVGADPAYNVVVTLSSGDPYITFTDATETFGTINPGAVVEKTDAFAFDVADNIPDGHYVIIDVQADGTSELTWTSNFAVEGHAPVLELGDVVINDQNGNNNGKIDPGETVSLIIAVENTGSSEAFQVIGELASIDPFITINQNQGNYGNITGGSNNQASFNVTADLATPAGHKVDFTFEMSANSGITGNGTFFEIVGQIPVLILDLDPNNSSGPVMQTTIQNIGVGVEYATAFPAEINLYSSVFVCLGIYATNHVLTTGEGQILANYLNGGGALYMEGGDTWYYDTQTPVHSMFNINATGDGTSDMSTQMGQTGTFTEGMSLGYTGENNYIDHIEPVAPAFKIFQNQSPAYGTGVAYDPGTYKTIGASHEFGGLTDGASPSTKEELMTEYLVFFGIFSNDLIANFGANTTDVCQGEDVSFVDFSTGNIVSWSWTFEGGDPATSTIQSPTVTYNTPGDFDVTLTISDGTENNTISKPDFITVMPMPGIPAKPEGPETVCTNYTGVAADYSTTGGANAISYEWSIEPAAAGTIEGTGTTGTVYYTLNWEGTAKISVKGINDCGESSFSEELEVLCWICTGLNENEAGRIVSVFPNPSSGEFIIEMNRESGVNEIIVTDLLNGEVLHINKENIGNGSLKINLEGQPRGIYFLRVNTEEGSYLKKIILR